VRGAFSAQISVGGRVWLVSGVLAGGRASSACGRARLARGRQRLAGERARLARERARRPVGAAPSRIRPTAVSNLSASGGRLTSTPALQDSWNRGDPGESRSAVGHLNNYVLACIDMRPMSPISRLPSRRPHRHPQILEAAPPGSVPKLPRFALSLTHGRITMLMLPDLSPVSTSEARPQPASRGTRRAASCCRGHLNSHVSPCMDMRSIGRIRQLPGRPTRRHPRILETAPPGSIPAPPRSALSTMYGRITSSDCPICPECR
jgi:hypothetical protein